MYRFLLSLGFLVACLPMMAQQSQEEKRSNSQLVFSDFQDAKINQTFNRSIRAKVNIMYRNGALCFVDETDGKVKQAFAKNIISVDFDSVRYMKVDTVAMGRVVAQQGYNTLLCLTTIDMARYKELTTGGTDLPFFEIDMAGLGMSQFMDLSGAEQQANKGYPLKDEFFFNLKGKIIPAKEKFVKRNVRSDMKTAFKNLMADRWWSWKDEKSLAKLLMYFPE